MFSCGCGNIKVEWVDPNINRICNMCGNNVVFNDGSKQISLEAYRVAKKNISINQEIIFDIIKTLKSCNNNMIAKALGWTINRVTPRVKELRDMTPPMVIQDEVKLDDNTNIRTIFWKAI